MDSFCIKKKKNVEKEKPIQAETAGSGEFLRTY